jgi:hypothetical protein
MILSALHAHLCTACTLSIGLMLNLTLGVAQPGITKCQIWHKSEANVKFSNRRIEKGLQCAHTVPVKYCTQYTVGCKKYNVYETDF